MCVQKDCNRIAYADVTPHTIRFNFHIYPNGLIDHTSHRSAAIVIKTVKTTLFEAVYLLVQISKLAFT
jgi:hypothetical protein